MAAEATTAPRAVTAEAGALLGVTEAEGAAITVEAALAAVLAAALTRAEVIAEVEATRAVVVAVTQAAGEGARTAVAGAIRIANCVAKRSEKVQRNSSNRKSLRSRKVQLKVK